MDLNKKNVIKILLIITFAIALFLALENISSVLSFIGIVFKIFSPIILGACLAFILNVIMTFIETKIFSPLNKKNFKLWNRLRRPLSIILTLIIVLGILVILLLLIIPKINNSLITLVQNLPTYMKDLNNTLIDLLEKFDINAENMQFLKIDWEKFSKDIINFLKSEGSSIISTTVNVTTAVFNSVVNFVLSLAFSLYILASKEKLSVQFKKLLYTFVNSNFADKCCKILKVSNMTFSRFLIGQCTEALILGICCYIGMLIFSMPYAAMISALVGATALIPMFGAFIGTAIGAFLILLINPAQAFWFIVFIIILQQIEGNFIYPRVVGKTIGLPGIWVLASVTIGGSIAGALGMLISVPLCSILYTLLKEYVNSKQSVKK